MTIYVIAQLRLTDEDRYRRYQKAFPAVWKKFRGSLLAADEAAVVAEGKWDGDKVVLLSFPDITAYREWAESDEYQAISRDRTAGADTISLIVKGTS